MALSRDYEEQSAGRLAAAVGPGTVTRRGPNETVGRDTGAVPASDPVPRSVDLALSPQSAERLAAGGKSVPAPTPRSGRLESQSSGRGVVNDGVTSMTVAADGTVRFADKSYITVTPVLPVPPSLEEIRAGLGSTLRTWYRDPEAGTRFGRAAELSRIALATLGACDTWGAPGCDDPSAPVLEEALREGRKVRGGFGIGLAAQLDITSWLHSKLIGDLYSSRKLKLLDATRDERVASGTVYRAEQLRRSAELMTLTLGELWAHERDPVGRKVSLFELWDDCDEGEGPTGEAGDRARAIVIGWIRGKLPAGTPGAYTDEEVRAFAARRTSRQAFTPY